MALPTRRSYAGAADSCTLTGAISAGDTSAALTGTVTNWPSTGTGPFYMVIDPGLAAEEKVLVTTRSSGTISVMSRGQDGTTAAAHAVGAVAYPVGAAVDFDEANSALSTMTTKGDLLVTTGSAYARLPVGTNTYALLADSGAANGVAWGQIAAGGIATGAVTSAKILDATIVQADLALTLLKALCPVGSINAYAGTTAPAGWILCDGTAVVSGTHPELYALCIGGLTPDLKGRFALGKTTTGVGSSLLGTGGSTTILEANLPVHTHANTLTNNSVTSGAMSANSTLSHSVTDPNHHHTETSSVTGTVTTAHASGANAFLNTGSITVDTPSSATGISIASHTVSHDHTVTSNVTISNSAIGSGTAYYQPFLAVNYIIKHDYV